MKKKYKVIDMENHFYPRELFEHLKERKEPPYYDPESKCIVMNHCNALLGAGMPIINPKLNVCEEMMDLGEYRISRMDFAGVDVAALSCDGIVELFKDKQEAVKYARLVNDSVAAACKKYPDRFIGSICLPVLFVEESIKELERCVKQLGLKFWKTHSNYENHFLYEDMFEPIIAKCAELNVPIYIHPQSPSCQYLNDSGQCFSGAAFGFAVDVMKTTMRIVMKGTLDKYPKLRIILGHMGEFFPFILSRMDNRFELGKRLKVDPMLKYEKTFTQYFKNKNIIMTTSGIDDAVTLETALKSVGVDNIMFGTDFPYEAFENEVKFIENLNISEEDKQKIFHANAEKYILNK